METRLKSNEVLVERLLPHTNTDALDRAAAWNEWCAGRGASAVLAFVRMKNDTPEPDADIVQDALTTAYVEVERGRYEPRHNVPFTAYVKGIARNKIREARRRNWRFTPLEEMTPLALETASVHEPGPHLEHVVEHHEKWRAVQMGLSQLPPSRRQVLQCYLQGQSTDEIAEALGLSADAVRQHKCRGLRSLRAVVAS